MKVDEWVDIAALWADLWPHDALEPGAVKAWYPLLADLPGDEVAAALRAWAMSDKGWPPKSAGQLRAACEPPARAWEDAMADLVRLVGRFGIYATLGGVERPHAEDLALDLVIDAYGWEGVCNMDPSNPTVRAQFRDAYQAAQRRVRDGVVRERAQAITGGQPRQALTGGAR